MSDPNQNDDRISLREFFSSRLDQQERYFEHKFREQDRRLQYLGNAIEKLTGAIISREVFDELSKDVGDHDDKIDKISKRLSILENRMHIILWLSGLAWAILLPIIIMWISNLLGL